MQQSCTNFYDLAVMLLYTFNSLASFMSAKFLFKFKKDMNKVINKVLLTLSHVRHCTELSSLPSKTSDIMDRCFTGAFFPLDIPLCGEPGTGTGLGFAALGPPIVETA